MSQGKERVEKFFEDARRDMQLVIYDENSYELERRLINRVEVEQLRSAFFGQTPIVVRGCQALIVRTGVSMPLYVLELHVRRVG